MSNLPSDKEPLPPFRSYVSERWKTEPLGGILLNYFIQWWHDVPEDPWSPDITEAIHEPDAVMVCHHCLEPYGHPPDFCSNCGAAIGPYNNLKPFERIFSIGEVCRNGVGPHPNHSIVSVIGYLLFIPLQYGFFAPIYFFRMLRNRHRSSDPNSQKEA